MPVHDDLGRRMKEYYERISKTKLIRRTPVIIRIDGRSFHSFTKNFKRPFDDVLIKSMQQTMKYLCENIQGCVLGYHQSDEISLVLVDYQKLTSDAWFDYEIQKICSIVASMATMAFNKYFSDNVQDFGYDCCYDPDNDCAMCSKYYYRQKKSEHRKHCCGGKENCKDFNSVLCDR